MKLNIIKMESNKEVKKLSCSFETFYCFLTLEYKTSEYPRREN